jgi:hypothetical protein
VAWLRLEWKWEGLVEKGRIRLPQIARGAGIVVAVLICLLIDLNAGLARADDDSPPTITAFDFSPKVVDVSSGSVRVQLSASNSG